MPPPPPRPASTPSSSAPPAGFFDAETEPKPTAGGKRGRSEAPAGEGTDVLAMVMGDDDDDDDDDDGDAGDAIAPKPFVLPPPSKPIADTLKDLKGDSALAFLHPDVLKAGDGEKGDRPPGGFFDAAARSDKERAATERRKARTADEEMAAFEAEIADDVEALEEREHEEAEERAYERIVELVEEQKIADRHLDELKAKLREVKERAAAAAAEVKAKETDAGTREEALSDIDSEEEREFEEFSNDWRGLRTHPS